MQKDKAVSVMKTYFMGDEKRVNHALRVTHYAEEIFKAIDKEGADSFAGSVIVLAGIFHDIGIPEAERKYNSAAAPYQEKEGVPIARKLMEELDIRPDIRERVCYIVGHHHTQEKIDGLDFQIIWEADYLVNVQEGSIKVKNVQQCLENNFQTAEGRRLFSEIIKTA